MGIGILWNSPPENGHEEGDFYTIEKGEENL